MVEDIESVLRAREDERTAALLKSDYDALAELVTDDLVHVHATGMSENKRDYLDGIQAKLEFLAVSRPDLKIRIYGQVAVMTGPLVQSIRIKGPGQVVDMTAMVTQVWRLDDGVWRICSFQATKAD